ncbi:MAG: hypothetical protein KJ915_08650 [Candidatus Omnitrophica bacterium]|nr:hypothetical protein [Candidatus Omnitrophota bacterium]
MKKVKTTVEGYINRNNQEVIRKTNLPGNDHLQCIYILRCGSETCRCIYGVNGSDIFERKCPNCQEGKNGLRVIIPSKGL